MFPYHSHTIQAILHFTELRFVIYNNYFGTPKGEHLPTGCLYSPYGGCDTFLIFEFNRDRGLSVLRCLKIRYSNFLWGYVQKAIDILVLLANKSYIINYIISFLNINTIVSFI